MLLICFDSCGNNTGPLARPRSVRFSTFAFSSIDMPHDFCPESVHNVEHAIGGMLKIDVLCVLQFCRSAFLTNTIS